MGDLTAAHNATRCTAKSKRTGESCRAPAVRGWAVCRMHGAKGGAKPGREHPNWKHGGRSAEAVMLRKLVSEIGRESRKLAEAINVPDNTTTNAPKGDI